MNLLSIIILSLLAGIVPAGSTFVEQLTPRDSILIADQIRYGVVLKDFRNGDGLAMPDFKSVSNDTLTVLGDWKLDTLVSGRPYRKSRKLPDTFDLRASLVLAPFEPGEYTLPSIPVLISGRRGIDSLLFEGSKMTVTTIPIDTTSFIPHDIKDPVRYPVTFAEIAPWIASSLLAVALIVLVVLLIIRMIRRRKGMEQKHRDPPHIVALRLLEQYRSEKYWAPEKQKAFYSGVTDALKEYIDARFGVDAPEMTTAELFDALSAEKDIDSNMLERLRALFETADFVKFARHTVDDKDNSSVVPLAVSFVTSTYQAEIESAAAGEEARGES